MKSLNNFAAIVLAAGKGKRMKSKDVNKVTLSLGGKPMVVHTIELLSKLGINQIVVVVGFAKESVVKLLKGKALFSEQKRRMGTAHAVLCAMPKLPKTAKNVLVLNGDDSALYDATTIKKLILRHLEENSSFTFLTIEMKNPQGLGRVSRDKDGKVLAIVEEKDATLEQLKIREINPACYVFKVDFLRKYLRKVKKSPVTGEYYLTSLIDLGIKNGEKIETLPAGPFVWRGVNTKEELEEAEKLFLKIKRV
jgi:UDP-N-acetylglucosamine diphosphorylase/glucosamine-1-phosphate N-acetyltransferase